MDFNRLSVLGAALILQLVTVNTQASEISGVTPIQSGGSNIYNINPDKINGSGIGFKQYGKFDLSSGDAANFIMTDVSKFVNLVDSKVNINGLVNTVNADMSKSNGGLIFVSPEGFVVGSTGVLNVGSLSVYTPDSTDYSKFATELADSIINGTNFNVTPSAITYGSGVITIDGSLITNGDINLNSKSVNIGKDAHVVSGLNTSETFMSKTSNNENLIYDKPEDIFYSLVNTRQMSEGKSDINIKTNGGNLSIGGLVEAQNGDINIAVKDGNLVNAGSTDILLSSSGNLNITVTGANAGNVGEIPANTSTGSNAATRDFTKSINVQVGGDVNIDAQNAVNLASIDNDLIINNINAGDVVYLTVDKTPNFVGDDIPGIYSSKNHVSGTPNVKAGGSISIVSDGNIGSKTNGGRFTISSTSDSQQFNTESWNSDKFNYTPISSDSGIEVISNQGDIYIKDIDKSSNIKNITAKDGSINAQFAGNTYIDNIAATEKIDVLTQGSVLYVKNLDNTKVGEDVYKKDPITGNSIYVPPTEFETEKGAKFTALGLGEDFSDSSDSIIILKNGRVQGSLQMDSPANLEFMADNVYADGMHATLGKDRVENPEGTFVIGGGANLTKDDNTSEITIPGSRNIRKDNRYVTVKYSAVSEDAVNSIDDPVGVRDYYKSENGSDSFETSKIFQYYSYSSANDSGSLFGDTDDDSDSDDIGDIIGGDTDDDGDLDPPITSDSDDDNDSGNEGEITDPTNPDDNDNVDEPDIGGDSDSDDDVDIPPVGGDTDDDGDDDIPGTGDSDSDDDVDIPPVGGDTDDDGDDDIPGTGDSDSDDDVDIPPVGGDSDDDGDDDIPGTGDSDSDDDVDIPPAGGDSDDDGDDDIPGIGDNDSDDDIDEPPAGGDTDDDDDDDIPGGGGIPGTGDNDTDDDIDVPPSGGDTDNDDDDDVPGTKPVIPDDIDPSSPIPEQYTINTEPPKPMSVVPEIGANNITPEEDVENDSPVNSNGLFLDNDTDTDMDIDKLNKSNLTKKKRKFFFRYRFR